MQHLHIGVRWIGRSTQPMNGIFPLVHVEAAGRLLAHDKDDQPVGKRSGSPRAGILTPCIQALSKRQYPRTRFARVPRLVVCELFHPKLILSLIRLPRQPRRVVGIPLVLRRLLNRFDRAVEKQAEVGVDRVGNQRDRIVQMRKLFGLFSFRAATGRTSPARHRRPRDSHRHRPAALHPVAAGRQCSCPGKKCPRPSAPACAPERQAWRDLRRHTARLLASGAQVSQGDAHRHHRPSPCRHFWRGGSTHLTQADIANEILKTR